MPSKRKSPNDPSLTQSEACAVEVVALIRSGKFLPGMKLSEYSLSKTLGYGLSPVKMALNSLAEGGILERRHRSGTYVRSISKEEYLNLLEIRVRLEGLAALQASINLTASDLTELENLAQDSDSFDALGSEPHGGERLKFIQKDTDFHLRIAEASRNRFLMEVLSRQHLLQLCFLYAIQISPPPTRTILAGVRHIDIVNAFRRKNARQAEDLMQRHIGRIREFLP